MEIFESFIGIIIGGSIGLFVYYIWNKGRETAKKSMIDEINIIESESLRITPQMKQSLEGFSIKNASQLRQMNSEELLELLSCAAKAINVFEARIQRIEMAYESYESYLNSFPRPPLTAMIEDFTGRRDFDIDRKNREQKLKPQKDKLNEQYAQAMIVFEEDLLSVESVLNVIPERYRMTTILNMMCEYLAEGEVDSWEGCIKTFKEDAYRVMSMENSQAILNGLNRIERNTAAAAFFAGLAAWNTL